MDEEIKTDEDILEDAMVDYAKQKGTDLLAYFIAETLLSLLSPEQPDGVIEFKEGQVICKRKVASNEE